MKPWRDLDDHERIKRTAATGELYFWLAVAGIVIALVALVRTI